MKPAMQRASLLASIVAVSALALTACAGGSTGTAAPGGATKATDVKIVVPADPGGGWDQTGRAMSQALTDAKIVASAPVSNVGGAGGTVGLAQLANETKPHTLMVMGLVMVGAVETNAAKVRIENTTPIARLTEEPLVIVVPAASKYTTLAELVKDIVANGQSVSVTGGSAGGADHILAGLVLEKAGLSGGDIASKLNYIPNSGGGEATSLIVGNQVSAGISGVGEFVQYIESGEMRALAVSSDKPVTALPKTPTIVDAGYDVVLTNWRGVVAPGSIGDAQRAELERLVTEMHDSTKWQADLKTRGWADAFLVGTEFGTFLDANIKDVTQTLKNIGLVA